MHKKNQIKIILLSLLLIFNAISLYGAFKDRFITRKILSKEVTIIDKYSIGGDNENYFKTDYMKGKDDNGEIIVIIGNKYNIGDRVKVYINENSVNTKEWQTDIKAVDNDLLLEVILFLLFIMINIIILIYSLNKSLKRINIS